MLSTKTVCRLAHCICSPRNRVDESDRGPEEPLCRSVHANYLSFLQLRNRLVKARARHISLILSVLKAELAVQTRRMCRALEKLEAHLYAPPSSPFSVSSVAADLRQLEADLRQLEQEFGGLMIHRRQKAISVNTEPITLEDVELGRFAIKLFWEREWASSHAERFEIIALDPNPAASDDTVTHPHVKDQVLCAGEAASALGKALTEKRIADAFCLVRSVLRNYNPDSPHVRLSLWGGRFRCHDCGDHIPSDDRWICEQCGEDLCSDCICHCIGCQTSRCAGCMRECAVCKEKVCEKCCRQSAHSARMSCCKCLTACPCCSRLIPKDELANLQGCPARCSPIKLPTPERTNADECSDPAPTGLS